MSLPNLTDSKNNKTSLVSPKAKWLHPRINSKLQQKMTGGLEHYTS